MKTKYLGKNNKNNKSGRDLLDCIERIKVDIKYGHDIWNVYDFMYLDQNKIPNPVSYTHLTLPTIYSV